MKEIIMREAVILLEQRNGSYQVHLIANIVFSLRTAMS